MIYPPRQSSLSGFLSIHGLDRTAQSPMSDPVQICRILFILWDVLCCAIAFVDVGSRIRKQPWLKLAVSTRSREGPASPCNFPASYPACDIPASYRAFVGRVEKAEWFALDDDNKALSCSFSCSLSSQEREREGRNGLEKSISVRRPNDRTEKDFSTKFSSVMGLSYHGIFFFEFAINARAAGITVSFFQKGNRCLVTLAGLAWG